MESNLSITWSKLSTGTDIFTSAGKGRRAADGGTAGLIRRRPGVRHGGETPCSGYNIMLPASITTVVLRSSGEAASRSRHPSHAPSLGIDRSGRASRISGCLPRSAKCAALYGLVKAGIAHTSGRPSKGAEQSGTSCFKVPRSAAQRHLTPDARHFMMCEFSGLAFKRTRLHKARPG